MADKGTAFFLPFSKIVSIKVISIFFDFVLAAAIYKIVRLKYGSLVSWSAFFAALFAPTVMLNSALWAQCDVIFASFVLGSIYFLMTGKSYAASFAFAIALSFKLQAMFFLPVLFILWLKREVPLLSFLLVPATILASFVPSMVVGRPFAELAKVYLAQAETWRRLTLGAPNLYQWFSPEYCDYLYLAGISFTAALFLALSYAVYASRVGNNTRRGGKTLPGLCTAGRLFPA